MKITRGSNHCVIQSDGQLTEILTFEEQERTMTNPVTLQDIQLRKILALPHPEFLPQVFYTFLGRDPDPVGLLHYAARLQKKISRTQILIEIRSSDEGKARASSAPCRELDAITRRYQLLKKLPGGYWRWRFLPRLEPFYMRDDAFPWVEWAATYSSHAPTHVAQPVEFEHRIMELQDQIKNFKANVEKNMERLSTQGMSVETLLPLKPTLAYHDIPSPSLENIPHAARSIYLQILVRFNKCV